MNITKTCDIYSIYNINESQIRFKGEVKKYTSGDVEIYGRIMHLLLYWTGEVVYVKKGTNEPSIKYNTAEIYREELIEYVEPLIQQVLQQI